MNVLQSFCSVFRTAKGFVWHVFGRSWQSTAKAALAGYFAAAVGFGATNHCAGGPGQGGVGCASMDANFDNLWLTPAPFSSSQASSLLYGAGDSGTLYTMTIGGAVTSIGAIGTTMFDIAMYNGALYGIDGTSSLYSINTTTGHGTVIGSTGQVVNALTFSPTGVLYAAGNDTLYTVNVSNGKLTAIGSGTGAGTYSSSGDLEFLNGVLYLTSSTGGNDQLFSINAANGQGHLIGSLGFPQVYGLVQKNGALYGFTDTGSGTQNILSINTTTGAGTTIHTYTLTGANVGFYGTTDDPLDSPEPGPLGLVGLGLAVVVAASRWRRRVSCRFHQRKIPSTKNSFSQTDASLCLRPDESVRKSV